MSYSIQKQWGTRLSVAIGAQVKTMPAESLSSQTMRSLEGFAGSVLDSGSRDLLKAFGNALGSQSSDFIGRSVVSTGEGNVSLTSTLLAHYQENRKTQSSPKRCLLCGPK
ncbi:MAG: hypothetical protein IPO76_01085 [Elusimicrobia bacterium]|nr:hypothetical protein [Elusimicrobiota bacterium]